MEPSVIASLNVALTSAILVEPLIGFVDNTVGAVVSGVQPVGPLSSSLQPATKATINNDDSASAPMVFEKRLGVFKCILFSCMR